MDADIYKAVQTNDPTELLQLINSGGDVNTIYQDLSLISTKSILHIGCEKGRIDCVKVLIQKGANLAARDSWYQTPLMYCMITQWYEIAEILLDQDQDIIDIGDMYGRTTLHIAVKHAAVEGVKILLKYGADIDNVDEKGITPLNYVCGDKEVSAEDRTEIVRILIEAGANPNCRDFMEGRTALQRAMITGNVEVVEMLLAAGSQVNTLDSCGRCPVTNILLYHRRPGDSVDVADDVMIIIIMLIQAGADLNISKCEHSNALCMATMYQCTNLVQYLLYNGADQNVQFYCGVTPLQIATRKKDLNTAKVLLNWKSDLYRKGRVKRGELDYQTDVFHLAIDIGAFEIAMLLVEIGYDLSRVDYLTDWSICPPDTLVGNQSMLEYFRQGAMLVQSLFRLAIFAIRDTLSGHTTEKATLLPLPKQLIKAVQLEDELT
ncbi:serine/threonine-protein phosphatase 6 regulatory ankyrin repeat subunit C-like isoform X2 [Ruditapes philippinarum]|uniref:serine/threonine-protein phosphatase 6 regulatory ankyrin repeat subunit C-like isoform X2 n=1 Tax=Ruditapes philippinarum TaxID=129788 RepID=UPI00295BEFBB|nr:serine/threonine-protein phosphatase 6 regulatory ankyrin repeat subunit C-like isoform X2 [Ruditapes philippinarum]XP_060600233.1 serine/threonine-protein phosphatase 6 regulatory ankyrin repeat subunit C-like isoform X2 [Ruditapes philippinarum]